VTGPTYVQGARALSAYLAGGGRLLLSGQDALCTDARSAVGTDACNGKARPDPYVRDQLFLRVAADNAVASAVDGGDDGPLAGMTLALNGPDSLDNQTMPDVLEVVDPMHARIIATYPDGRGAAVLVDGCVRQRVIALGFGFEGIRGASARDALMARALDTLGAGSLVHPVVARVLGGSLTRRAGATADYTVTVQIDGLEPADLAVTVEDSDWPATLWAAGFAQPLTGPLRAAPCAPTTLGVRVQVPPRTERGASGHTRIAIRSTQGGAPTHVTLSTRTPAPVLVVDGDFGRNTEARYLEALTGLGVAFDHWEVGLLSSTPTLPALRDLTTYPIVVWFTGDDWRPTGSLNLEGQRNLAGYLDAGGRLYFASEDYLSIRGGTPFRGDTLFHQAYLGVSDFVANAGSAHGGPLRGAPDSILAGVTACSLAPRAPGEDYSDRLLPENSARAALVDTAGFAVAVENAAGSHKTLFAAFDAGELEASCAGTVMGGAIDAFSPLTTSRLSVVPETRLTYAPGDEVHLRLSVVNDGPSAVDATRVQWRLPVGARLDPTTVPPQWTYDQAAHALRWTGDLPRNTRLVPDPEITVALDGDLGENTHLTSTALLAGDGITITRTAEWRINAPDLRESSKSVPDDQRVVAAGQLARFTIAVRNTGTHPADDFILTDTLPVGLLLVRDSVFADAQAPVDLETVPGAIVWHGSVAPGRTAALTYAARVRTFQGGWLRNTAVLDDRHGDRITLAAAVFARPQLLFPWLGRQIDPDP
jgi:uncharacterized repeat protein (TIGR01451 family)